MGTKNTMGDLRDHLFEVIERLKDPDPATPMDTETAKVIVETANTLVDTQRAENEFIRSIGGDNFLHGGKSKGSRFLIGDGGNGRDDRET